MNAPTTVRARRGFTLVELLVVIAVIGVIASMMLVALQSSQESAREAKTRAMIAKLDMLMRAKIESYRTRRIPMQITNSAGSTVLAPSQSARLRLTGIRQLMRLELPDRNSDIPDLNISSQVFQFGTIQMTIPRPAVSYSYKRRLGNPIDNVNSPAEALYIILTTHQEMDISGRELFKDGEIGDTDNDGLKEFLDGWGKPIFWIRWPTAFVSDLQPLDSNGNRDPVNFHDPYDPRRVQPEAFALYPLIYSSGPDGKNEIQSNSNHVYVNAGAPHSDIIDPYAVSLGGWVDTDSDSANDSIDNIHNHMIGTR